MTTTNPVPSNDPTDLLFNAQKLDQVVNGSSQYYTDRLGVNRRTVEGISAAADVVLGGLGYAPPVTYASGISMTLTTQTVEYSGEIYAPKVASLPFTTSTWATDSAKFRLIQGVAATDLAASGGAGMIGYMPAGTGAVETTVEKKLHQIKSVKDSGAIGDYNVEGNDAPKIMASEKPYRFPRGAYRLDSTIKYQKDSLWSGDGKSFNGSILKPTGDFAALEPDTSIAIDYTKNTFSNFQIDASNITTAYALKIDNAYLTSFKDIWIRNSTKGVQVTNSDSISFHDFMIMEDSNGDAVLVGDNARSIKFYASNFEKNPGNTNSGGVVRINGTAGTVANADFYGCQLERGGLYVDSGTARWYGGKIGAESIVKFGPRSTDSFLDCNVDDASLTYDFGYNNTMRNVYSMNMQTPKFMWPNLIPAGANNLFGAPGDEYLFSVSAGSTSNAAITNGQIYIMEAGTTILAQSPQFSLQSAGTSIGMTKRPAYTFISCVRSTSSQIGPTFTNCQSFAVRGGRSLLTNGTMVGGIAGWSLTGATSAQDGNDNTVVFPTGAWRLYQDLTNKLIPGRRYIAMAKFSGSATLVLGNASDGTAGSRTSFDNGVAEVYDGDKLAQIAFEYRTSLNSGISIGSISNAGAVTIKWLALIDMDEAAPGIYGQKTFDPVSLTAGTQVGTTVSVFGASFGDCVSASFDKDLQGVEIFAYVSSVDTVTVFFKNGTTGTVDLGSGNLRVTVIKR